ARDRDAARGLVAAFDAAPLPRGVVELDAPDSVRAGRSWRVAGRAEGAAGGRAELVDPAGAVAGGADLDANGRFALDAPAKGAGRALFALRVLDRERRRIDEVAVPLVVQPGAALKLVLLAGAPDPELKYLRRWAVDAGLALDERIGLSDRAALVDGAEPLDADALRAADVAIVDERAWAALDAGRKAALLAAVGDGLGLLLRATAPPAPAVAADWSALGFDVRAAVPAPVALTQTLGLDASAPAFARAAIEVDARDAAPLLRADDGTPLALWRAVGAGRVGLWWLADSYRLALAGARTRFGTLWSDALGTLARARGDAPPELPRRARVGERAVACRVAPGDGVEDADGARTALVVDASAAPPCAAYWPTAGGWHALVRGATRWPFFVRAADAERALAAADDARATRALVGAAAEAPPPATRAVPLPRWPFFLGWLASAVALWWLERRARPASA
ncbi:MAG TPA: hypothetical protein VGC30_07145, partial [Dokdonella sp.]